MIGSSTDAMRRGRLKEFGADLAVDSSDPGWVDQVLKATGGEGVDLIVDQVSGQVASQNLKATKIKGRIVNVGRLGGTHGDFNFDLHAARRINYIGVTFRTRTIEEIREIFDEVRKDIWGAVESRKLQLPIDKVYHIRRHRQGVRAHGSQQAPRQDRGDAVGPQQRRVGKDALAPCPPFFRLKTDGGRAEPVIGRAFARPGGFAHPTPALIHVDVGRPWPRCRSARAIDLYTRQYGVPVENSQGAV